MSEAKPLVIGHRGAAGEAPENTLSSFKLALEQGCDAFELDVHLSKDGQLVVIHDTTVNRTTDGTGSIHDMTVEELKKLDAGRWFHERFAGERLPLLEEVFDLAPQSLMINVEIKAGAHTGKLEPVLAELLKKKNRMDSVVVSSFDYECLHNLKEIAPEVKIGLLYDLWLGRHWKLPEASGLEVYSLHPRFPRLRRGDVQKAIEHGLRVYAWTVNEEEHLKKAIQYGMSGIITDYPGRLRKLLGEQ